MNLRQFVPELGTLSVLSSATSLFVLGMVYGAQPEIGPYPLWPTLLAAVPFLSVALLLNWASEVRGDTDV